jgi:hypothetical protein
MLIRMSFPDGRRLFLRSTLFTDLGFKVAINDQYTGLVYSNQVYEKYEEGQKTQGVYHRRSGGWSDLMSPCSRTKAGMFTPLSIKF